MVDAAPFSEYQDQSLHWREFASIRGSHVNGYGLGGLTAEHAQKLEALHRQIHSTLITLILSPQPPQLPTPIS